MRGSAADVVRDMLVDSALIVPAERDGRQILSLAGAGGKIAVTEVPSGSVAVKLGASFPQFGRFLSPGRGLRQHAGYVILGENEGLKFIVCIETDEASLSREETGRRMRGAICAMDYCASLAREFFFEPNLFEGAKWYFIKVRRRGIVRKRFRYASRFAENGSPESVRVVEGDSFPFSSLVSGPGW